MNYEIAEDDIYLPFPEKIDRKSVRSLVEAYTTAMQMALENGENIHQMSLDQKDRIDQFAATLSEEDQVRFFTLYAEEMEAHAAATNDRANALNAQTVERNIRNAENANNMGTLIGYVLAIIAVIWVFQFLSN